jgi:uroporphyrinogen-III synthase
LTRVLVLRPEPGASETLRKARERGLDALAIPLFEIEPVAWETPDPARFDGLLLTSANALRHGGAGLAGLKSLPVHAVGAATADAAREAGFTIAGIGSGGVAELLDSIPPDLRLLHLCGEDRAQPDSRRTVTTLVVYRSKPVEIAGLGEVGGGVALIHSPRAGKRFAELASDRGSFAIAAISRAAADAVGTGWRSVAVAPQPADDALLALAARLCNNLPPK